MSHYDDEGNLRDSDGTFLSSLGPYWEQRQAGITSADTFGSASNKLQHHQWEEARRKEAQDALHSQELDLIRKGWVPAQAPAELGKTWGPLAKGLVIVMLTLAAVFSAPEWLPQANSFLARAPHYAEAWALQTAFKGEAMAPFSSYAGLVPVRYRTDLSMPPKRFARELQETVGQPISNPRRFAAGAVAWRCLLENPKCFEDMGMALPGAATMTSNAAHDFIGELAAKGNKDAAADAGLVFVKLLSANPRARSQARMVWMEALATNPADERSKALLGILDNSLALRLSTAVAWVLSPFSN